MAAKKKTAKKKTAKKSTKPRVRFEGTQALIPGVKPKKRPKAGADTYTAAGVDGVSRTVSMPEASPENASAWRRRPHGHVRTYTGRMELRMMPEQGTAWDRMAAAARLTRAEWIRQICDAAVAAGVPS